MEEALQGEKKQKLYCKFKKTDHKVGKYKDVQ